MERAVISNFSISSELLIESLIFDSPKCLIHTNYLEINEEFGRHHLRDLYIARHQTIPEIRLHRVPGGVNLAVHGDEDFVLYLGDRALAEQIRPYWTDDDVAATITQAAGRTEVSEEAILVARFGLRTWGHWLGELLPKVVCVERAYPGRFRYVVPASIVTDVNLRTMRQSLDAYGIGRDRLLFVHAGRTYRFANLFAVSPVWFPLCPLHPHVVNLMRTIIPPPDQIVRRPKSVALLRRESTTRNLAPQPTRPKLPWLSQKTKYLPPIRTWYSPKQLCCATSSFTTRNRSVRRSSTRSKPATSQQKHAAT